MSSSEKRSAGRPADTNHKGQHSSLPRGCTGRIEEGRLAHDGETCPVHEGGSVLSALREAVDAGRVLASYTQGFSENRTVAEAKESIERAASVLQQTDPEGGQHD